MKSSIFRRVFTIVIIYAIIIGTFSEDDFESIFLRIYVGTTLDEYIDYPLENASEITSRIIKSKPTVLHIHGFTEYVENESVRTVIQAYLKRNDYNIIAVDYGKLANDSYIHVAGNVPRIADVLTTALYRMKNSGFDTEKLHIVAQSLGAQIAGYIGRNVKDNFMIPRITGLDPAGPLFNFIIPHLSFSDARFVDIIHTDYGFYGIAKCIGTVDFFPNNGKRPQPGCPEHPKFFTDDDFCSHRRAWRFYAESLIDEFAFTGVQCSSSSNWISGKCINNTLIYMGYATPSNASGTVYLMTKDKSPFGLYEKGLTFTSVSH